MSSFASLKLLALTLGLASACPQLQNPQLTKRQDENGTMSGENRFWAYEASHDWGRLHPGMPTGFELQLSLAQTDE